MNNNGNHKRVSDLNAGETFVHTATRYVVESVKVAEMSHPTNQRYMSVVTDRGTLKIPANLLIRTV